MSKVRMAFSLGEHTLRVPLTFHADNRARLCNELKKVAPKAWVMLQGGDDFGLYSTDVDFTFRQESYFHWTFGVLDPGFFGAVRVTDARSFLFLPRLPKEYGMWMGTVPTPESVKLKYTVDETYYIDEMVGVLEKFSPDALLCLSGLNTDSGKMVQQAVFDGINKFNVNTDILHDIMAECRVFKSPMEQQLLRYANEISSKAHIEVMKRVRPGMKEYQMESIFRHYCYYYGGCRHVGYTCICGSGGNAAILHYGHAGAPNDKTVQDGDMCLLDMGGEYYCYSADITCSYPANGKFTAKQRAIYETVLKCSRAVFAALKPGVSWTSLHRLSYTVMLEELKKIGLVKGDVEEMVKANIGAVFQPHGLGHFLGLDVHDVGGYLDGHPAREKEPGFKNLRTAREMKANMALTIEPGCYFIEYLLEEALANPEQAKFLDAEKIAEYRGSGGVRIEDDVIVTETGAEMLTVVPRDIEEIERVMAEGRALEVELPQAEAQRKLDS